MHDDAVQLSTFIILKNWYFYLIICNHYPSASTQERCLPLPPSRRQHRSKLTAPWPPHYVRQCRHSGTLAAMALEPPGRLYCTCAALDLACLCLSTQAATPTLPEPSLGGLSQNVSWLAVIFSVLLTIQGKMKSKPFEVSRLQSYAVAIISAHAPLWRQPSLALAIVAAILAIVVVSLAFDLSYFF